MTGNCYYNDSTTVTPCRVHFRNRGFVPPPSWFKKDFFKWTNKPPCSGCGARGGPMQLKGGGTPTPEEAAAKASRVELYVCKDCPAETRFPRYNDPAKLLETRNVRTRYLSGRCSNFMLLTQQSFVTVRDVLCEFWVRVTLFYRAVECSSDHATNIELDWMPLSRRRVTPGCSP